VAQPTTKNVQTLVGRPITFKIRRESPRIPALHHQWAAKQDEIAVELMRSAASHIDALAKRLIQLGAERIAVVGGLAVSIEPWLTKETHRYLVPLAGDALEGALRLARMAAEATTVPGHPLADQLVLKVQ
jgi:N-acetylglucosamine kinase-like BadF-type ATPase